MIYLTSDFHFAHANCIRFNNRPFASVEEMDETLIRNWNERVTPEDDVFFLGDWGMKRNQQLPGKISRLNGRIHMIRGNHDKEREIRRYEHLLVWIKDYHELNYFHEGKDYHFVLMHYPIEHWSRSHWGSCHVHGHCHSHVTHPGRRLDVGVDAQNYRPISIVEVIEWAKDRPYGVRHHQ